MFDSHSHHFNGRCCCNHFRLFQGQRSGDSFQSNFKHFVNPSNRNDLKIGFDVVWNFL